MKLWFCGMSGPNSLEDLVELLDPIKSYFDGIVWVLHDSVGSEEDKYLESIKGEGKVIHYYYSGRHDASRNQYLWCGPIKQGDWCCQTDLLERVSLEFLPNIRKYIKEFIDNKINMVFYYHKPFLFEYHESLQYIGSPHEGIRRNDHDTRAIELSQQLPNEKDVRINVRPLKRKDPYQWMWHYLRYYLGPWGSNHCLLGNENRGDPMKIYAQRERIRLLFRDYIVSLGASLNVDSVKEFLTKNPTDVKLIEFVNQEKILNDVYRFVVLNDLTVNDNHHWKDLKKIQ